MIEALVPIVSMLVVLSSQVVFVGDFRPHLAILAGTACAVASGWSRGFSWEDMADGLFSAVGSALPALSIFTFLGILVASWVLSGTVPYIVAVGLEVIVPHAFLPIAFVVSSMVGMVLGSGISTVGTVGVALAGVGQGLGIHSWLTAGAVVSGAFLGNRTSPVSDTSALASQIAGRPQSEHVKYVTVTAIGPFAASLALYFAVGVAAFKGGSTDVASVEGALSALGGMFRLNPLCLLPVAVVVALVLRGISPLIAFFWSSLSAVVLAFSLQGFGVSVVSSVLMDGGKFCSGSALADGVVNRGGLGSVAMLFLMVCMALGMGGVLERTGSMDRILSAILRGRTGGRVLDSIAVGTTALVSASTGSASVGVVLAGRMFRPAYERAGRSTLNLSRCLAEGSILVVPLIPWAACGAFVISALGLSLEDGTALLYVPCSFFCVLSPLWAAVSPFVRRGGADSC